MIKFRHVLALVPVAAAGLIAGQPAAQAQSADGAALFQQRCKMCHANSGSANGVGPNLVGVNGRKAGSRPGYAYSSALKASGLTWNAVQLDAYLAGPQKKVPGTKMVISVSDAAQRKAIVGYLTTLR